MSTRIWSCALPRPEPLTPRVLTQVERIWARMRSERRQAGPILSEELRATRALGSKERRAAGDTLTGLIRHERALACIHPDPLTAWHRLAMDGPPDLADPENAYAIAVSLPDALGAEWAARLGDRAVEVARAIAGRAPVFLRVLRTPFSLPVPFTSLGPRTLRLDAGVNLFTVPSYLDGALEVQDLGSQRIAEAAFPGEGGTVLDLCAGAGGKALTLAAMGARVSAWDVRPKALRELRERAGRAGLDVRIEAPRGRYDVVLVDAPCSGTGVLRRHPENRWKLRYPVELQAELLGQARSMGARVVYATCALTRQENEAIAGEGTTLWPEEGGGDGFFWSSVVGAV